MLVYPLQLKFEDIIYLPQDYLGLDRRSGHHSPSLDPLSLDLLTNYPKNKSPKGNLHAHHDDAGSDYDRHSRQLTLTHVQRFWGDRDLRQQV